MKSERVTLNNLEYIGEGSNQRSGLCPFESRYLEFRAQDGTRYRWYTDKIDLNDKRGHYWLSCFVSDKNTLSRVKIVGSILDSEAAEE